MDGNFALQSLLNMTEEERKGVRILWFDKAITESFTGDNAEEEGEFFENLPYEKQGELLELGLYTDGGDFTKVHNEFLDNVVERIEEATVKAM